MRHPFPLSGRPLASDPGRLGTRLDESENPWALSVPSPLPSRRSRGATRPTGTGVSAPR